MRALVSTLLVMVMGACSGRSNDEQESHELPPIDRSGRHPAEDMIPIAPGSSNGMPCKAQDDTCNLALYDIDRHVVSWDEYQACVDVNQCWKYKRDGHDARVSAASASRYCAWRGASLPTGAQWEKAALREDGRFFPPAGHVSGGSAVERCVLADAGASPPCYSRSRYGVVVELFTPEWGRDLSIPLAFSDDLSIPGPGRLDPAKADAVLLDAFRCVKQG
jgi:Sulfatase-modifying factor enzyme 1